MDIADNILQHNVNFVQWESRMQKVRKKKGEEVKKQVYALYSQTCTLELAIEKLKEMLEPLVTHIHTHLCSVLDIESVITVEDYQMNITLEYCENPTPLAYSTNKVSFALYPICVEFVSTDNELRKGAIAFLSADTQHDHQQVGKFEQRMFEIIREQLGRPINYWARMSDGCFGQFKSRHCVADLMHASKTYNLKQVGFHYFASHEGKNTSDTIGSIVKSALKRGMFKQPETEVRTDVKVVEIIHAEVKERTKKFDLFIIEKLDKFGRTPDDERDALEITGIQRVHSLVARDGTLYIEELSCTKCTVNSVCTDCLLKPGATEEHIAKGVGTGEEDIEEDLVQDEDESDAESSEDEDDVQDECVNAGDIVWAKNGRFWYPAQVCSPNDIPEHVLKKLSKNLQEKAYVKWWGEDNWSVVSDSKVEPQGRNKQDELRANRSAQIAKSYHSALSEVIDI